MKMQTKHTLSYLALFRRQQGLGHCVSCLSPTFCILYIYMLFESNKDKVVSENFLTYSNLKSLQIYFRNQIWYPEPSSINYG